MGTREEGLLHEDLTRVIVGVFFDVYNELGYGLFESVYALAMQRVLSGLGYRVRREVGVVVHFRGEPLARQRMDMLIDDKVIIEIKSTDVLPATSRRQLLSYLKSTRLEVGLLLHFGPEAKFIRMLSSNGRS